MSRRSFLGVSLRAAAGLAAAGFPRGAEAAPARARLLSALTGEPLDGVRIRIAGAELSTGVDGTVLLDGPAFAWSQLEARADGHLIRRTCVRDGGEIRLWPLGGELPRHYVRELVYGDTGRLVRPLATTADIVAHGPLAGHGPCVRALAAAAEQAREALGITFRIVTPEEAGERTAAQPRIDVVVDRADPVLASTGARAVFFRRTQDATVVGGKLVLASCSAAHDERTLLHELGHLSLWHSPDPLDLMAVATPDRNGPHDFSPRERAVLRLMRDRLPGNVLEDDDRHLGPSPERVAMGQLVHRVVYSRYVSPDEVFTGSWARMAGAGQTVVCAG